ncbi:hypothetical protein IFM89_005834, partial [Coptis chinensis]
IGLDILSDEIVSNNLLGCTSSLHVYMGLKVICKNRVFGARADLTRIEFADLRESISDPLSRLCIILPPVNNGNVLF